MDKKQIMKIDDFDNGLRITIDRFDNSSASLPDEFYVHIERQIEPGVWNEYYKSVTSLSAAMKHASEAVKIWEDDTPNRIRKTEEFHKRFSNSK